MIPQRPASVSAAAICVYPGESFAPGIGVQVNTLKTIQSQVDHANNQIDLNYARALSDWKQNAPQYAAYHLQGPPQPLPPPHGALKLTYADVSGNVITDPAVYDTGLEYCWVEEIYG